MNDRVDDEILLALLRRIAPLPPKCLVIGSCALPLYRRMTGQGATGLYTLDLDLAFDADDKRGSPEARAQQAHLSFMHRELVQSNEYRVELLATRYAREGPAHRLTPTTSGLLSIEPLAHKTQRRTVGELRAPMLDRHFGRLIVPQHVDRLGLLFVAPWTVDVGAGRGVAVANPLSLVLQKAQIRRHGREQRGKADSDAAAILETAQIFEQDPDRLVGTADLVNRHSRKTAKKLRDALGELRPLLLIEGLALDGAIAAMAPTVRRPTPREAIASLQSFLTRCGVS